MLSRTLSLLAALAFLPGLALAAPEPSRAVGRVQKVQDRAQFQSRLRALGFKKRGGIGKEKTDHDDARRLSFPHFTSSFDYRGTNYPYTMVGYPPASGKTANVRSVIIPLRMNFSFFADQPILFEPDIAVNNIVNSPMYDEARFANGVGQFGDQLQRATFWNKMDRNKNWHVKMAPPRIHKTVEVLVEPDVGEIQDVNGDGTGLIGNVRFGFMDAQIHTILQFIDIEPDELPIFITYNVTADALGYHDAFVVGKDHGTEVLQTLQYTSWLEGALVGDLLADVSTFNHELGEWLNDPYVNNIVPTWEYPPLNQLCSDNPFLEVGDPQGNGPQFAAFPTVVVPLNGYNYHLQDLVMLPWFAGEVPSSAFRGWYDFPAGNQIKTPATICP